MGIALLLTILAVILLVLAALNITTTRVHLGWLGIALYVIASMVR